MTKCRLLLAIVIGLLVVPPTRAEPIAIGVAKVDVTPTTPVVLAGYGARTTAYEGIDTPLYARALVIGEKQPVAIVVLDNCGVPIDVRNRVAAALKPQGISNERLVVAATHTHNAPNLEGYASILWAGRMTPQQQLRTQEYTSLVVTKMAEAVVAAMKHRAPLELAYVEGKATFGGNRRVMSEGTWRGFGFQRDAPVDHRLPTLIARDGDGVVKAVWANYACHCTTSGSVNRVNGDWAGFANEAIERQFPDAVSLMTIGCGADIGPQPSGNLEIARTHGSEIAAALITAMEGEQNRLVGEPVVESTTVKLPLAHADDNEHPAHTRAYWERELANADGFHRELAKSMLREIGKTGHVHTHVDYPVTAWKFGDQLAMVFLPGEVVVDYAVRLGAELDWQRLWLTAWANDMPGYIPSRRLLVEGGYESDFSQVYYDQPTRYDPRVEDVVVSAVKSVTAEFTAKATQPASPYHRLPSGEAAALERLASWVRNRELSEGEAVVRDFVAAHVGVATLASPDHLAGEFEETDWFNYAGDYVHRYFVRQSDRNRAVSWRWDFAGNARSELVCFTGGVGWIAQPKTDGFALLIDGQQVVTFDVTLSAKRWASDDGQVELVYLPTWKSNVDSGGYFFLRTKRGMTSETTVSVRSLGEGSRRWFAIDARSQSKQTWQQFRAAIRLTEE